MRAVVFSRVNNDVVADELTIVPGVVIDDVVSDGIDAVVSVVPSVDVGDAVANPTPI